MPSDRSAAQVSGLDGFRDPRGAAGRGPGLVYMGSAQVGVFAAALRAQLWAGQRVLLSGPADSDGDSIGSCLAMGRALRTLGVQVTVAGRASARYLPLSGAGAMVPDADVRDDVDVAIVLDGERGRLHAAVRAVFDRAPCPVLIDHHQSTRAEGYALALVAPTAASTAELVLGIIDAWGVAVDTAMAEAIYTGMLYDTGGFRHSNTDASTLRTAARLLDCGIDHNAICLRTLYERRPAGAALLGRTLAAVRQPVPAVAIGQIAAGDLRDTGASFSDVEGIIDHLLHIEGVELAALMTERAPQQVRLSLRSRRRVDCAQLARALDPQGGGHRRAAGGALAGPLELVRHIVEPALIAAVLDVQG
jgi:phosphoesterase RecJ-like protein